MLRTSAITQFFNANLTSPHLDTLLLTTPSGLLLSLSSHLPVSLLRTQATLASQIWFSYHPIVKSSLMSAALPSATSITSQSGSPSQELKCITIQLEQGIMVIRQLRCSLLFIAVGPGPSQRPQTASSTTSTTLNSEHSTNTLTSSRDVTPLSYQSHSLSSTPTNSSYLQMRPYERPYEHILDGTGSAIGSSIRTTETRSTTSGSVATSMVMLQRHAEELGKLLDEELANFELTSP